MTALHKRKDGTYAVRVWDREQGKQVWLKGPFKTKREALRARENFYERDAALERMSVSELRDRWLTEGAVHKGWRESTRKHNAERTSYFNATHGTKRADTIRVPQALQYALDHPRELPALRAMFGYGRLIEAVNTNPFSNLGIAKPKAVRTRRALTQEQVDLLAAEAGRLHGPWHESLIIFAASTGLRAGEIYALKFSDLGHDELTVSRSFSSKTGETLAPKNGHERTVVLPRAAREAITAMPRRPRQEFVFVNPRDGKPFTAMSYGYWWRQVRPVIDAKFTFHELRHTAATLLLERGAPAELVALQLGHVRADGTPNPELIFSTYGHPNVVRQREQLKTFFEDNVRDLRPVPHTGLTTAEGSSA